MEKGGEKKIGRRLCLKLLRVESAKRESMRAEYASCLFFRAWSEEKKRLAKHPSPAH